MNHKESSLDEWRAIHTLAGLVQMLVKDRAVSQACSAYALQLDGKRSRSDGESDEEGSGAGSAGIPEGGIPNQEILPAVERWTEKYGNKIIVVPYSNMYPREPAYYVATLRRQLLHDPRLSPGYSVEKAESLGYRFVRTYAMAQTLPFDAEQLAELFHGWEAQVRHGAAHGPRPWVVKWRNLDVEHHEGRVAWAGKDKVFPRYIIAAVGDTTDYKSDDKHGYTLSIYVVDEGFASALLGKMLVGWNGIALRNIFITYDGMYEMLMNKKRDCTQLSFGWEDDGKNIMQWAVGLADTNARLIDKPSESVVMNCFHQLSTSPLTRDEEVLLDEFSRLLQNVWTMGNGDTFWWSTTQVVDTMYIGRFASG